MPRAPRRPWLALVGPLLFLCVTAWLFTAQVGQTVDSTNRALKAPGTRDAANLQELAGVVPSDQVVLLGFAVPGELPILPGDVAQIAACRTRLLELPGVVDCRAPPAPGPGLALLAVSIRGDDLGAIARSVAAEARRLRPESMQMLATGLPLLEATLAKLVAEQRQTIVPLLTLVLFGAAWLCYRRIGLALAALLPALAAIAWTGGLVALLGHPLDPVAALLDPVLLTIGVATSVHFVETWRRGRGEGLDGPAAGRFACREQRTPTLLATATTMVGLLSLTTSPVPAVVDFGIRSSFGIALVHAFTFVLLPGWLARFGHGAPRMPVAVGSGARTWVTALLRHRASITAAAAAATALALGALPALRGDNDPLVMLPHDEAVRADHEALAARLGGIEVFHLLVPARSAGTDPARLLPFLASTLAQPAIAGFAGPVLRGSSGDLAVPLRLCPGGSGSRRPLFDALEADAAVLGLDGLVPAGPAVQMARDSDALMRSLFGSTVLTLALLALGMVVGLRSFRLGLLGMVPNVLPCLWIYGGLALCDRPVSVATAMIGCTMLGLIVDNTLHLLHQYRLLRPGSSPRAAITGALQRVGRPMWRSSLFLVVGFATAATSRLATTVEFSLLACTTIGLALLACTVLLPLLLATENRSSPDGVSHAL